MCPRSWTEKMLLAVSSVLVNGEVLEEQQQLFPLIPAVNSFINIF